MQLSRASGKSEHVYRECLYAIRKTWLHARRVIYEAEVVRQEGKEPKNNPRFVITNLAATPQWIYERVYYQRGDMENRVEELHEELVTARTNCTRSWANQFPVLMMAPCLLMQELLLTSAATPCARAQVSTLRKRLLKLGARVVRSVRRVLIHLPTSFPCLGSFRQIALALVA